MAIRWETSQELSDHLLATGLLDRIKHTWLVVLVRFTGVDSHLRLDLHERLQKSGCLAELIGHLGATEHGSLLVSFWRVFDWGLLHGLLDQEI